MQLRPWILAAALTLPLTPAVMAQPATPAPVLTTRTVPEVARDIGTSTKELASLIASRNNVVDPAKRAEIAPKVIPVLNRLDSLMQELGTLQPEMKPDIAIRHYDILSMKAMFGDTASEGALKQAAESTDTATANSGKAGLLAMDWVNAARDAAAQAKVLDRTAELAKANPTDKSVALLLVKYLQLGAASAENRDRVLKVINEDLKGPVADQIRAQIGHATTQPADATAPAAK